MWLAGSRNESEFSSIVGWQVAQFISVGCGGGGGAPWQLPQVDCVPSTWVQTGSFFIPPHAVCPWQCVVHVVPVHIDGPAMELNVTSALLSPSM